MKFKLQAGAEMDILTKDELTEVMGQTLAAYQYGVVIKPLLRTQTDPNNTGSISISVPDGLMWDIRSVYVTKSAADLVRVYRDNVTPGSKVCAIVDDTDNGNYQTFRKGSFLVRGGQTVLVQAKTGGTVLLTLRLQVMEVADGHDWHVK